MTFREKVDKILKDKELSLWKLAEDSGLKTTLQKAYGENREMSPKKTTEFLEKVCINSVWWKSGKGDVFLENGTHGDEQQPKDGKVPLYDAIAVGGNNMLADQSPISGPIDMVDPGDLLRSATGLLVVRGQSMFPKYPSGCYVAFKRGGEKIPSVIVWGEDYVIELEDRRILKRVEKGESKDHIKAVSYNINKENKYMYDPIDIHRNDVKRMYMVLGKVELEASI